MNALKQVAKKNPAVAIGIARLQQAIRKNGLFFAFLKGIRLVLIRLMQLIKEIVRQNEYNRRWKLVETAISEHHGFFDVFPVPMGWNTQLFQRFQHISLQVQKLGGFSLYGGHPAVDKGIFVFQKVSDALYIFDATNKKTINKILELLSHNPQPCILRIESIDLVTSVEDIKTFINQGFIIVYEYIDEIHSDITGEVPDLVHQRHDFLLRDERIIITATSDKLFEKARHYRSKNVLLSPNGVDVDHWRKVISEPPGDLLPALTGKVIVGYHGALARWIDYDLIRAMADNGKYEVVLIGHEHDRELANSGLKKHPRVHYLGGKSYFSLNAYAYFYDIAILPFKKTNLTDSVSPVKIFEYMAAQKPIVTTDLWECRKYRSCLVAKDPDQFLANLEIALTLRTDSDYLRTLNEEAEKNSWQQKTREILELVGISV